MVAAARCTHMVAQLYNQLHNLLHNQLHNLILVNTAQHCLSHQILVCLQECTIQTKFECVEKPLRIPLP